MNSDDQKTVDSTENLRKNLVINPWYQYRFLAFMIGVTVLIAAIFYLASHLFVVKFETLATQAGLPDGHPFFEYTAKYRIVTKAVFTILSVIVMVGLTIAGLIFSHRAAGPLYRLKRHMDQIAAGGALEKVQFRPKDYFQDMAESFNKMVDRLRGNSSRKS